jgi:hypothetical protein
MSGQLPPGMVKCPIWGTPAHPLAGYSKRDGTGLCSPRAGGNYFISRSAEISLKDCDPDLRIKLTHEIVDHNMLGSVPEILTTTLEGLAQVARSRPIERTTRLLQYLVRESRFLGQELDSHRQLHMWENEGIAGIGPATSPEAFPLFAWSDSTEEAEILFLLQMLAEDRAIRLQEQAGIPAIVVLPRGYDRVLQDSASMQHNQAFIAMWFDRSMKEAYELGIEAAVREIGYQPLRIDQKEHVNKIDDEIIAEIRRSRFLIADFTCAPERPRGGVYFEAGYALALGKTVIWCCRSDRISEVHFDTRQFNHIVWDSPADLKSKLKNRIGAVVGDGPFSQ